MCICVTAVGFGVLMIALTFVAAELGGVLQVRRQETISLPIAKAWLDRPYKLPVFTGIDF